MTDIDDHVCRDPGSWENGCLAQCGCGRGPYCTERYSSCYDCFLDRRSEYVNCLYCSNWHSPEFDTCFKCRPRGRDEAARDVKLVIVTRDGFKCRYCGVEEGDLQVDPRLIRPKCLPSCAAQHNHRYPCKLKCGRQHRHRKPDDPATCRPRCTTEHAHLIKDDDGIRAAKLHIDHIQPCSRGGTADPWNLQTLCGVCNIGKGNEWWPGCRHYYARLSIVAAYATYLWDFLAGDERCRLNAELDEDGDGWDPGTYLDIVKADYVQQVKACRPRPPTASPIPQVEDVPREWAHLDLDPISAHLRDRTT